MGLRLHFLVGLMSLFAASMALSGSPKFEKIFKEIPKRASQIEEDLQKKLPTSQKNIVAFDLHGVFTKELGPSKDGKVTLNNRFIPAMREALKQKAQTLMLSAHDQPKVLYAELQSLTYGEHKDEVLYIDFTKSGPKYETGILYLPFAKLGFQIIEFAIDGNIVSVKTPGSKYYKHKAEAVLIRQLSPEGLSQLRIPPEHYRKISASAKELTEEIAAKLTVAAPGTYFPEKCFSWGNAQVLSGLSEFILSQWHNETSEDDFLNALNVYIEKAVCGRERGETRFYPYGKPSQENRQAVKDDLKPLAEKLSSTRKLLVEKIKPADIDEAIQHLSTATRDVALFFVDDSFDNLTLFQETIEKSGYFEDSSVYLEFAQNFEKDKELSPQELRKALDSEKLKKSN